ncbi:MAG: HEPN domain-containing protein [Planctomycetota bacterium]
MPRPEDIPGPPGAWLERAKSNLLRARMERPEGVFLADYCFDAQQAAEKALKAVLLHSGVGFRYVHALHEHVTALKNAGVQVPADVEEAAELTDYAIEARYPGAHEPVGEAEYRRAVAIAERVVAWAEAMIGS